MKCREKVAKKQDQEVSWNLQRLSNFLSSINGKIQIGKGVRQGGILSPCFFNF